MTARIIDMFTRKPVPDDMADAIKDQLTEFKEVATRDPDEVSAEDQEWFCSMFRDMYLADLLEAVRGIEEADMIADLEVHIHSAIKAVREWPAQIRTTPPQ